MDPQLTLDAMEIWVSDLERVRRLFTTGFGFQPVATDRIWLASGGVRLILWEGEAGSPVAQHVSRHGDTIADVGLLCANPAEIVRRAVRYGLTVHGTTIDLLGDRTICHSLRSASLFPDLPADDLAPRAVDHVAYGLARGTADAVAQIYQDVFGMRVLEADSFDEVGGSDTGMRSIALRSEAGFTVVLTEPVSDSASGQTQRFLDAHAGPGVQHVALRYDDLPSAVEALRKAGVEFLPIPEVYYKHAKQRLTARGIDWETLQRLEILADADHEGQLFQLFTRPIADRGTFFLELIERAGSTGFGAGNVRALFDAVQATFEEE